MGSPIWGRHDQPREAGSEIHVMGMVTRQPDWGHQGPGGPET
eukprot:CAMPEP_0206147232 /NCGR_PEP_ID=MMETSP1473-20131121/32844_1 /ASSEMBLY_ACC=CAM_ASM_001109 /TAXON_ID=1461547 /ORGANISM="Stichococcus sp, Strain RCC1054" /LENGTH=41 /DNA_ID= /DNA_START= /DNA_END= /DNA_ORIENTATION=